MRKGKEGKNNVKKRVERTKCLISLGVNVPGGWTVADKRSSPTRRK